MRKSFFGKVVRVATSFAMAGMLGGVYCAEALAKTVKISTQGVVADYVYDIYGSHALVQTKYKKTEIEDGEEYTYTEVYRSLVKTDGTVTIPGSPEKKLDPIVDASTGKGYVIVSESDGASLVDLDGKTVIAKGKYSAITGNAIAGKIVGAYKVASSGKWLLDVYSTANLSSVQTTLDTKIDTGDQGSFWYRYSSTAHYMYFSSRGSSESEDIDGDYEECYFDMSVNPPAWSQSPPIKEAEDDSCTFYDGSVVDFTGGKLYYTQKGKTKVEVKDIDLSSVTYCSLYRQTPYLIGLDCGEDENYCLFQNAKTGNLRVFDSKNRIWSYGSEYRFFIEDGNLVGFNENTGTMVDLSGKVTLDKKPDSYSISVCGNLISIEEGDTNLMFKTDGTPVDADGADRIFSLRFGSAALTFVSDLDEEDVSSYLLTFYDEDGEQVDEPVLFEDYEDNDYSFNIYGKILVVEIDHTPTTAYAVSSEGSLNTFDLSEYDGSVNLYNSENGKYFCVDTSFDDEISHLVFDNELNRVSYPIYGNTPVIGVEDTDNGWDVYRYEDEYAEGELVLEIPASSFEPSEYYDHSVLIYKDGDSYKFYNYELDKVVEIVDADLCEYYPYMNDGYVIATVSGQDMLFSLDGEQVIVPDVFDSDFNIESVVGIDNGYAVYGRNNMSCDYEILITNKDFNTKEVISCACPDEDGDEYVNVEIKGAAGAVVVIAKYGNSDGFTCKVTFARIDTADKVTVSDTMAFENTYMYASSYRDYIEIYNEKTEEYTYYDSEFVDVTSKVTSDPIYNGSVLGVDYIIANGKKYWRIGTMSDGTKVFYYEDEESGDYEYVDANGKSIVRNGRTFGVGYQFFISGSLYTAFNGNGTFCIVNSKGEAVSESFAGELGYTKNTATNGLMIAVKMKSDGKIYFYTLDGTVVDSTSGGSTGGKRSATVSGVTYTPSGSGVIASGVKKGSKKITIPAFVKIGGKKYNVTKLTKNLFKKSKCTTLIIKSTKLTKAGVKNSLKGSKVRTVKVPKSKYKAYKKIFTKKNCGKKVTLKKI